MTLSRNDFLCNQHFAADGAVLALCQAGFRAGGRHSLVDYLGVAIGGNYFLGDQHFVADGAVLALRQAGFRAGGRHSFVSHYGVACGVDRNRLGIIKFLPVECKNCGVNGLTGRRAGRSSEFSIDYRRDCLYVSAMHAVEDRLGGAVIIRPGPFRFAVFVEYRGVGGVAGHGGDFRIPIREGVGVAVIISLDGSLVSGRFAVFITLSSLYVVDDPGDRVTVMFVLGIGEGIPIDFYSGRINGISHMFATPLCLRDRRVDSLRVGLIVLAGEACAGGFIILAPAPDRFTPVMPRGGNYFLGDQHFVADGAVLALRQAGFRAGGLHGSVDHFGVTGGRDNPTVSFYLSHAFRITEIFVAAFTAPIGAVSGGRAGRFHRRVGSQVMTEGHTDDRLAAEFNSTDGAVDNSVIAACPCAGGANHVFFYSFCRNMTDGRDLYVGGVIAARTGVVGFPADLRTGRRLRFMMHQVVTQRVNVL